MAEPRSLTTTRPQSTAAAAPTGRMASRQSRGACRRPESAAAPKTQSATLASSEGCSVKPPGRLSQRCAPLRSTAGRQHEHEQQGRDHEHARRERGDVPVVPARQQPERREADRGIDRVVLEQCQRGRGRVDHDDAEGHECHGDDHEQLLGAARLGARPAHASASTSCAEALAARLVVAELVVRRAGRREQHDVALGGHRGRDPHGALERPAVHQLDATAGERAAQLGRSLADQVDGRRAVRERIGEGAKSAPLSEPPRITCSGASNDASACSVASTLVALESLT